MPSETRCATIGVVLALLGAAGCASREAPLDRAALLASKGRESEAIALLREDLARDPRHVPARRLLIRLLGATGNVPAAEREVRALSVILPSGSPIPLVELGHVLELSHRYDEALSLYDRAAAVAPRDPVGPRTGGMRAAHWGEFELAAPRLEEALRRNPSDAAVWHALGLVRAHSEDWEGARTAYESGLIADPDALENRIGLATLALRRDDPAAALEQYEQVLRRRPRFADAHLGRSWALIRLGRLAEAERAVAAARQWGGDARVIAAQTELIRSLRRKRESPKNQ